MRIHTKMNRIEIAAASAGLVLIGACTPITEKVERAETECTKIGYDYAADGVAATECTENGVRQMKSSESGSATSALVGIGLVLLAAAL